MKKAFKKLALIYFIITCTILISVAIGAESPIPGDVNMDGEVNIRDAATILLYSNNKSVVYSERTIDTNGDGSINVDDAEFLLKAITDHNVTPMVKPCKHQYFVTLPAVTPTCTTQGKTEGHYCLECNETFVEQTIIPSLDHIGTETCTVCGENLVIPDELRSETGYITTEDTVIETKYFLLHIPANIYVPGDLVENLDLIGEIMEEVSGLTSAGNPHYQYGTTKTQITVLVQEVPNNPEQETWGGFASLDGAYISPYDLVFSETLIHEVAHVFQYRQSNWHYCEWAMESISTYTTYKVQKYIESNYPDLCFYTSLPNSSIYDMGIDDYSKLYEHTMEYWADNTFLYSGNTNYSIGFRFAHYLDEVYGDYTKWIYTYEELYPCYNSQDIELSTENQLKAFKLAYGEDVFDNFYPWLQENEDIFEIKWEVNIQNTHMVDLYPKFVSGWGYYEGDGNHFNMHPKSTNYLYYSDLYINLQPGKFYLSEYKHKSIDLLELTVAGGVTMSFYDSEGKIITTVTSSGEQETFDLTGVDFIKLVGTGTLHTFERLLSDVGPVITFELFNISGF